MKSIIKALSLLVCILIMSGCNISGMNSSDSSFEDGRDSTNHLKEQRQVEVYIPEEDDVILKNNAMRNKELLDEFMKISGENNDSEIRLVKYEENGVIIYNLLSRYDENADVGWIEVNPDLSHYEMKEEEVQDIFNNAPQQCAYMTRDTVEGFYKLNECRTNWEYRLVPIVSATLTDEDLENINVPDEKAEIIVGNEYYLNNPMTEIFLSKKDAEAWFGYYIVDNEKKLDEVTQDNIAKILQNKVEFETITENKLRVMSCEVGLCEVYSEDTFDLKAFVVPEVKINTEPVDEETEDLSKRKPKTNEEAFWKETSKRVSRILKDTSELLELYESGDAFSSDKKLANQLYDRVNGDVIIIRHAHLPDVEEIDEEYFEILMRVEFLFNALYQAEIYVDNEEVSELEVFMQEEMIPLHIELKELAGSITELQFEE